MYLRSKSGHKMLIDWDVSRDAKSYSLAVRLASACFKITILELVCSLEYATTSLICKLRDCFLLKQQIGNIHLGQHGIFHGYIACTATPVMSPKKQSNSGTNAKWIYMFWFTIYWAAPESESQNFSS